MRPGDIGDEVGERGREPYLVDLGLDGRRVHGELHPARPDQLDGAVDTGRDDHVEHDARTAQRGLCVDDHLLQLALVSLPALFVGIDEGFDGRRQQRRSELELCPATFANQPFLFERRQHYPHFAHRH